MIGARARAAAGLAAVGVALALLGAACGERSEPTGATVPTPYPLTVQLASEEPVEIASAPQRVLPVSASAAAIIDALGKRSLVPNAAATGRLRPYPVRAIAGTPADLVLGSQANDANALQAAAEGAGTPLVVLADSSIAGLQQSILQIGLVLGAGVEARELVRRIDDSLAEVKERLRGSEPVRVFVDTGFTIPVPDDSFAGELLRAAGAVNIAGNAEPAPFGVRELKAAEPDWYLATEASGSTLESLRETPGLGDLAALQEGRFAVVPGSLFQPTPDIGDAILELFGILHPDAATGP